MVEVMEGRMHVMHSDPEAVRKGTKDIVLTVAAFATFVPACHLTYIIGGLIGRSLFS